MKGLKKLYALMSLLIVAIISISSLSYAMFVYNDKDAELEGTHTTANLVNFSSVASDFYQIYFFASPLYATGANLDDDHTDSDINTISDSDEQDPLIIANSSNNPYNDSTTDYWTINGSHSDSSNKSNFNIDNSNYTWIPSQSITQESGSYGSATITPYKKSDFTGYIRENTSNEAGLKVTKTSKFFSITVEGQITASQLNAIVATSEYKDSWGFGPEFIGWSYSKSSVASRIEYSTTQRAQPDTNSYTYTVNSTDSTTGTITYAGSSKGSGTKYLYGNYGRSSDIELISDSTSLQYIDNYTSGGSSIDGSEVGDKIIYLYPVFGAKQTSNLSSYHNLIKFRRNPGSNPESKQSDEIDYTQNRLTRYLTYSSNNGSPTTYNYSINDYYLSSSDTNRIDMSINSTSSLETTTAGYGGDWPTLITSDEIKSLNLTTGYYDIRLSIWYSSSTTTVTVTDVFKTFYSTNYYDAIMYSHSSSGSTSSSVTINGTTIQLPNISSQTIGTGSGNNSASFYYVIGFHKISEHRLTGDQLSGSISSYNGEGYRRLPLSVHKYSDNFTNFYFVENVELYKDEKFTVLDGEVNDYKNVSYTTKALGTDYISDFNTYLSSSSNSNTTGYASIDTTLSPIAVTTSDSNKSFTCSKDSNYSFLFTITYAANSNHTPVYSNSIGIGVPSGNIIESVNIAYKEVKTKCKFIVLSDPSKRYINQTSSCTHTTGFDYVYDEKAHWARCNNCGQLWTSEMNSDKYTCNHIGEEEHVMQDNKCTICGYTKGESSNFQGAYFNSYSNIYNFDSYICSGEYDVGTIINTATVLNTKSGGDTLMNLLNNYWGKELVDISTGLVCNYRVFLSNKFTLNRNYVLYIRNGSTEEISSSKINTDCDINFNDLTEKQPNNFHYSTDNVNGLFISGSVSNNKSGITYNGETYNKGIKLESDSGQIEFDLAKQMTVTLVFSTAQSNGKVKIDGVDKDLTYDSTNKIGTLTITLDAGKHTISKGSNSGELKIYLLSFKSTSSTTSE